MKPLRILSASARTAAIGILALATTAARADVTFTVDTLADQVDANTADGACLTSANTCSLRAAIMQANHLPSPGTIRINVPVGIFVLSRPPSGADGDDTGDLDLTQTAVSGQSIVLHGASTVGTIIDANHADRAIRVEQGRTARIENLTLRNGHSQSPSADGGGVLNLGTLAISRCLIENNQADHNGGGIYSTGDLTVTDSTVRSNSATLGGGFFGNASEVIRGSTINDNSADIGGGIFTMLNLSIVDSTISHNFADSSGGGIYNDSFSNLYVFNSTIVGNEADHNHDMDGVAGGVYNASVRFNLVNGLVAGNTVRNAFFDDCFGAVSSFGHNLFSSPSSVQNCTIDSFSNWSSITPSTIGPLQDNGGPTFTHALLPGSEAIDATDDALGCVDDFSAPLTVDQRGGARRVGARCDVGAFEYGAIAGDVIFANAFENPFGQAR